MTPIKKLEQLKYWSYSVFQTYIKCPFITKCKYILKLKEPGGPSLEKGNRIHALAEVWVTRQLPRNAFEQPPYGLPAAVVEELKQVIKSKIMPQELFRFEEEFAALIKEKASGEGNWGFTKNWDPCSPTDWARCFCRIKVDTVALEIFKKGRGLKETHVFIVDYKTGKEYAEHKEQRSLYALGALIMYPDAKTVKVEHWYLDSGTIAPEDKPDIWMQEDLERLKVEWGKKTTALLNDTTFAPRPSEACRYCFFRKSNNGPCVHG
jgi:hypothetical protein